MTTSALDAQDRARCATLSRWLATSSIPGALALGCAAVVALGLLVEAWRGHLLAAPLLVLALTPFERYLALRLRFDAGLFADLAGGRIGDLAALDAGLAVLGVRRAAPRTLDDRLQGTRQLWRYHAVVVALMTAVTAAAVVFA